MALFLASSFVSRCRDAIWSIHILTSAPIPISVHDSIHVHLHLLQYSRLFSHLAGNDFVAARHMSLIPQNELCRDATRRGVILFLFLLPPRRLPAAATSPSLSVFFPYCVVISPLAVVLLSMSVCSLPFHSPQPHPRFLTMLIHSLTDLLPFPSILARVHPSRLTTALGTGSPEKVCKI